MSRRRLNNSWRAALRDARKVPPDTQLRELVRFLARRAAEDDFESLLMRQRRKNLKDQRDNEQETKP